MNSCVITEDRLQVCSHRGFETKDLQTLDAITDRRSAETAFKEHREVTLLAKQDPRGQPPVPNGGLQKRLGWAC